MLRENERALNDSESDGKSMSTAGKTTGSTRLALKEAQEELAELKLAAQEQIAELKLALNAVEVKLKPDDTNYDETMMPEPEPATPVISSPQPRKADMMDTNEEPSDIQLMRAAINGPRQATLEQDSDAMEEDQHSIIHLRHIPRTTTAAFLELRTVNLVIILLFIVIFIIHIIRDKSRYRRISPKITLQPIQHITQPYFTQDTDQD